MTNDIEERLEHRRAQLDQKQEAEEESRNLQQNRQEVSRRKFSTSFFDKVANSDLDSELQHKIEEALPATFSSAHITGQRRPEYSLQQDLLNRAKAERFVTEHSPGAHLKQHPGLRAVADGQRPEITQPPMAGSVRPDDAGVPELLTPAERRIARSAIREVATTQQSLAVGGTGLKQFTTATSEVHNVDHSDDDDGLIAAATGGIFG